MKNKISINPEVLKWARVTAGYKLDEFKENKLLSKIEKWESGEDKPTYRQLELLAKKFARPVALFFFPEPPAENDIKKSLRSMEEESLTYKPLIRKLFRKAQSFQLNLQELVGEDIKQQSGKLEWLDQLVNQPLNKLPELVRSIFGLSLDEQFTWSDPDQAIDQWRKKLSDFGIYVFKDAFKTKNVSGFCIYDKLFPIIFINNSQTKNRQIFTIFHELAHIILRQNYLDIFNETFWRLESTNPDHIEVKCNIFAANFLVPNEDFVNRVSKRAINDQLISDLADKYIVSREVILRKLFDNNKIDFTFYEKKILELQKLYNEASTKKKKPGGNHYNTKLIYLGDAYVSLVFKNVFKGNIEPDRAAFYLGEKLKNLNTIEEFFLKKKVANVRF